MLLAAAVLQVPHVESGPVEYQTADSSLLFGNDVPSRTIIGRRTSSGTAVNATTSLPPLQRGPGQQERELERRARRQRQRERNARAKEAIKYMRPDKVEKVTEDELNAMMMKTSNNEKDENQPFLRRLGWGSNKKSQAIEYLSPGEDYDMWSQAYRMLGGFIDCDHKKDEGGSHDDGDNNNGDGNSKCSRWMMWAAVSVLLLLFLVENWITSPLVVLSNCCASCLTLSYSVCLDAFRSMSTPIIKATSTTNTTVMNL